MSPNILVVDDEIGMLEYLSVMLEKEGHTVFSADSGSGALQLVKQEGSFDLIICDIRIPDINGIELLRRFKQINREMDVILITAFGNMETMNKALEEGASDYLIKPFSKEQMIFVVRRTIDRRKLMEENVFLRRKLQTKYGKERIIGKSKKVLEIFETIEKVANLPSTVLITGESGTGKELVAAAIHYYGSRSSKPFVTVNCGALPETLLESELFGHKKGAFTSAVDNKQGLLEFANGGTFLLDEVGDMSPPVQVKLLRFLTNKKFKRIGGIHDISVDVRVIAATNRNLNELVKLGSFRSDLFYRLNVIPIHIPPLRERKEDIPLLIKHFLEKFCHACGSPLKSMSPLAMELLVNYDWPGNVRELENLIERIVALEPRLEITPDNLPLYIRISDKTAHLPEELLLNQLKKEGIDLDGFLTNIEKQLIVRALEKSNGIKKQAAKYLNISFRSFRYRLEKHELEKMDELNEDEL